MTMDKKAYSGRLLLKADDDTGTFQAVFATLNVVDSDGDVTLPGAFGAQKVLIEPWNHDYGNLPVGRGEIAERTEDNKVEAIVDGKFFLNTPAGKDHYEVVKALADMQEFSYSFYIEEAEYGKFNGQDVRFLKKLDVIGVGPVMRGAGVDTRVTAIKGKRPGGANGEGTNGAKPSGGPALIRTQVDLIELED